MAKTIRSVKGKPAQGSKAGKRGAKIGSKQPVADARLKIIKKNRSKMTDARDQLVKLTKKSGDARAKLEKIRNLKKGMLDVKTTSKGGITITTTTQGKTLLTTKKKTKTNSAKKGPETRQGQPKNVTKSVGRGGSISLKTRNKTQATLTGVAKSRPRQSRNLTRTIKGEMSASAKLDMELMNTKVDPVILKRTVNQDVHRPRSPLRSSFRRRSPSPLFTGGRRLRSRSPMDMDVFDSRRGRSYHYDDPRRELEREESYSRRLQMQDAMPMISQRTMADRFDSQNSYTSPLEGAKVVVSNLQTSVTKDDIIELFGDVGALKRAKVSTPGTAEVVFVNRADALKAVEVYHNRQLDGKAMKCQLVGSGGLEPSLPNSQYRLPGGGGASKENRDSRGIPTVEVNSIHKALFNDRRKPSRQEYDRRDRGADRSRRY